MRPPHESGNSRPLPLRTPATVFVAALVARAAWGLFQFSRTGGVLEFPDEHDYWNLAASLADHGVLVGEHGFHALRMPLFPAFLALFANMESGVVAAKIAQWAVGSAAAALVAVLGTRIAGKRIGLIAGLLAAIDPFQVFFSSLLLTETPFMAALTAFALAVWPLLERDRSGGARGLAGKASSDFSRWIVAGVVGAVCVYFRESSLGLVVVALAMAALGRRIRRGRAIAGAIAGVAVIAGCLTPWAFRNKRITGEVCWLTNRGGISLYDGVGPRANGSSDLAHVKQMDAVRGLGESDWNRYFLRESLRSVRDDPIRVLRLATVKMARTWNPLPNAGTYRSPRVRLLSAAWTLSIYTLAIVGLAAVRRDRTIVIALLLPAVYFALLHAVFVGSVRYRLPAMPFLEILAAIGLARWFGRVFRFGAEGMDSRPAADLIENRPAAH